MPKDEFDFDDPMELNGIGLVCAEDTTEAMTECFVEEFMRLGYNHKQILALFRNPHYIGMNMALQNRGEQFVRDKISEIFERWGRPVSWPSPRARSPECGESSSPLSNEGGLSPAAGPVPPQQSRDESPPPKLDPMGAPIPDVTI